MKTIKINLFIIPLVVGIIILTVLLVRKNKDTNKEIRKLKAENIVLEAKIKSGDIIIKYKNDTISNFKKLIALKTEVINDQKKDIAQKKEYIKNISAQLKDTPPDKSYEFLQANLDPKSDDLEYDFSGNQVHQLHEEKLELIESRDIILGYQMNEGWYGYVVETMDSIMYQYEESLETAGAQLSDCKQINSNKDKQIKKLKKQKINRNVWIATTAIATLAYIFK